MVVAGDQLVTQSEDMDAMALLSSLQRCLTQSEVCPISQRGIAAQGAGVGSPAQALLAVRRQKVTQHLLLNAPLGPRRKCPARSAECNQRANRASTLLVPPVHLVDQARQMVPGATRDYRSAADLRRRQSSSQARCQAGARSVHQRGRGAQSVRRAPLHARSSLHTNDS